MSKPFPPLLQSVLLFLTGFFLAQFLLSCTGTKNRSSSESNGGELIQKSDYDSFGVFKSVFDIPELVVSPSPSSPQSITLNKSETVLDFDVSPAGPIVAALIKNNKGNGIKFWQIGNSNFSDSCGLSAYGSVSAIVWHPQAKALFVVASKNNENQILKIEKANGEWQIKSIFSSPNQLRRLVICPRPFEIGYGKEGGHYAYRLFFGMRHEDNGYRIVSVTESGKGFYQAIGPEKTRYHGDSIELPSFIKADYALPVAFHPAGHQLIWEMQNNKFSIAEYGHEWDTSKLFKKVKVNAGSITPTPNGLGLFHWQKDKPGIGLIWVSTGKEEIQLPQFNFTSEPSSVADGRGIVGLTESNGNSSLNYLPVNVPLPDVHNAWMFATSGEELNLFQKNYGLFRNNGDSQLYLIYDPENYLDESTPARPYLVTTDNFWEIFGAAYEGLFILKERTRAMPFFWSFVNSANDYYAKGDNKSEWAPVFSTLVKLNTNVNNPEVQRILNADENTESDISKKKFNYTELKTRGHYTSSPEMEKYFKAFKYFTTIYDTQKEILEKLNALPEEIKEHAVRWIESYNGFIAPPRGPLVWKNIKSSPPSYNRYPKKTPRIFPLSWGFDNEALFSTVYHRNIDVDMSVVIGRNKYFRTLPSALDLAAALGSNFAETLLEPDIKKYPPLKKVIDNLRENFRINAKVSKDNNNLYDRWLSALSVQWTDTLSSPNKNLDKDIWNAKRLQTGLASWATLRHATVLVNERSAAEAGEGGFEVLLALAPRGYVEPDPYTFGAIADLFETTEQYVSKEASGAKDIDDYSASDDKSNSLYEGIIKRLKDAAADTRLFQKMAEKEKHGELLSNEEYEKIHHFGGVAEHYFLIFKSLANKEYALSNPDPMSKIADVANDSNFYLMSAVGNALEWDYVTPHFGRHQIVKGSIYSYYEFPSTMLMNDEEWRKSLKSQDYLPWLKPYVTETAQPTPASTNYF